MAKDFSLSRKEKMKSRKATQNLFASGKSVGMFPLRVWYQFQPVTEGEGSSFQMGVSASKKNFKRAVQRNRIKRLLREAYRLQKKELLHQLQQNGLKGCAFFVFVDKTLPTYQTVFDAMNKVLKTLHKKAVSAHEDVA